MNRKISFELKCGVVVEVSEPGADTVYLMVGDVGLPLTEDEAHALGRDIGEAAGRIQQARFLRGL